MNKLKQNSTPIALRIPIFLALIYLAFTLLVYCLCPYEWPTERPVLFFGLNISYIMALFFGYHLGLKKDIRLKRIEWTEQKTKKLIDVISWLVIINFVIYFIYVFRSYGFKNFDFSGLAKEMMIGIQQPGLGYHLHLQRLQMLDGKDVVGGYFFTALYLLWGFFKIGVAILAMLYFKKLKPYGKLFTLAYLLLMIVYYMSIGTTIQIFHVFLLLELPVILETFEAGYHHQINGRKICKLVSCIMIGLILVMVYFGWMMESRSNTYGYEISEYMIGDVSPEHSKAPTENLENEPSKEQSSPEQSKTPIETQENELAGEQLSPGQRKLNNLWISFSSYLSQGYYGMSQALTLDWTPMFGLGNSMFVVDTVSDHFFDIKQYTYQSKLEPLGWDSKVRWHSMYTWLANDVSFYGVVVVMFFIGIIFSMMFRDAIETHNPFAQASIFFYILMIIFIPCNNQVGQSSDNLCAFLLLIALWLLCGRTTEQSKNEEM